MCGLRELGWAEAGHPGGTSRAQSSPGDALVGSSHDLLTCPRAVRSQPGHEPWPCPPGRLLVAMKAEAAKGPGTTPKPCQGQGQCKLPPRIPHSGQVLDNQ